MDRRSFLKALGTAPLAGYSAASVAEAASPLMGGVFRREAKARMPSMKVIGIGGSGLALMQSMQAGPDALVGHVQPDYLSIRFNGRITRGVEPPDMEWAVPLNYHRWREVADDLNNVAAARQKLPGMERELTAYVKDADVVLLLVSLDNAMSFAACDTVAKIARNSSALTVVLVGAPYGHRLEEAPDKSLRIASHGAVNKILREADCVIALDGMWKSYTIESVCWDFGYQSSAPCQLLSAVWAASTTGGGIDRLKSVLAKSGKAVYGDGVGHSVREAVEDALDERHHWFGAYGKTFTAASGIVIVSGHPKSVNAILEKARAELARIAPLKIPHWGGKPDMLFLAVADDRLEVDGYFSVSIISTGIGFAGES